MPANAPRTKTTRKKTETVLGPDRLTGPLLTGIKTGAGITVTTR